MEKENLNTQPENETFTKEDRDKLMANNAKLLSENNALRFKGKISNAASAFRKAGGNSKNYEHFIKLNVEEFAGVADADVGKFFEAKKDSFKWAFKGPAVNTTAAFSKNDFEVPQASTQPKAKESLNSSSGITQQVMFDNKK